MKEKYTRVHEPKHLHPERKVYSQNKTFIIKEFSTKDDKNPYYPINDSLNREKHRNYKDLANRIKSFYIGGRLADYAYYDMDMTISAALKKFSLIRKNLE